ncbi:helix-turn-helix domain-containing protein [Streptomyces sp. cmx-18-6]|uniref:helix-turn-helix domain-containing protein n=1 Tax=Streptomyces sp. cmx-18-6 TaxID=2790930 RepID=UPI0039813A46
MSIRATNQARAIPLRPFPAPSAPSPAPSPASAPDLAPAREPLWRDLVGDVLRRERLSQGRTLKDVADTARISMAYLSEVERGRKEASSEVLAAAAQALGLSLADVLGLTRGTLISLSGARSRVAGAGRAGHSARQAGQAGQAGPMGGVLLAA